MLELIVRAAAREVAEYTDDVFCACSVMRDRIRDIKSGNHIDPSFAYRAILTEDLRQVQVWHFTTAGDRDKLILTISK